MSGQVLIVLGVDAGGTNTRAVVWEGGKEIARAHGPAGALHVGRATACAGVIAEVARQALAGAGSAHADVLVAGVAGAGREPERTELETALRAEGVATRVQVTTDVELALAAAFGSGPGIVLSVGTGSIAMARAKDGTVRRAGGWGWQMGDEGSGYAIGRAALAAVSRSADGRDEPTALRTLVLAAARATTFDDLVRWARTATPGEVASLAPAVIEAAARGDAPADAILLTAAADLGALAAVLAPTVDLDPAPVAVTGGLMVPGAPLRERLAEVLRVLPGIALQGGALDPVEGARRIAEVS